MVASISPIKSLLALAIVCSPCHAFYVSVNPPSRSLHTVTRMSSPADWNGQVVSNTPDGRIQGCTIQPANPESLTEWILNIDGVEADLGRFSDAIYKKILGDAKRQRFQGFRPGTIPSHLLVTYMAFAMDECARECVLEAMQQNNIRPFDTARSDMVLENFSVPPLAPAKSKKKKSGRKQKSAAETAVDDEASSTDDDDAMVQWRTFSTMKEAIDVGGWKPGTSFSFVAKNVKGQKVKDSSEADGATPLGVSFR
jgi:hypothetical protein